MPEEINPHEPATTAEETRRKKLMKTGVFTACALGLHNFPEGFATFLSGLESKEVAVPVAVAIAIHNIPEGIAVAVPLREATGSRKKAFWWATLSGLAEPLGALIGFGLLLPVIGPATMGISFAAIAGIMVFISLDELLPTAEETGEHHHAIYGDCRHGRDGGFADAIYVTGYAAGLRRFKPPPAGRWPRSCQRRP